MKDFPQLEEIRSLIGERTFDGASISVQRSDRKLAESTAGTTHSLKGFGAPYYCNRRFFAISDKVIGTLKGDRLKKVGDHLLNLPGIRLVVEVRVMGQIMGSSLETTMIVVHKISKA